VVRWNIANGSYTKYTNIDGLPNNDIHAITGDTIGNVWVGTEGGVSKFDGTNWTTYTTTYGLASNGVSSIAIDEEGNEWFGAMEGRRSSIRTNAIDPGCAAADPFERGRLHND
jgi:ligand-binding sensor domain-containing protein